MARMGLAHKLARHLNVSGEVAEKLVGAGYRVPKTIKGASKRKLRDDADLSQKEVDSVKARWK